MSQITPPVHKEAAGAGAPVAEHRVWSARSGPYGIPLTPTNRVVVALVVSALFFERFERVEGAGTYPILPFPDLFFVSAIGLLGAQVAREVLRHRAALRPFGRKDIALVAFVLLLGALSGLAVLINDEATTSSTQVLKTFSHLAFLLGAALLLGRALSSDFVAYALKVYFVGAVATAALAIVQAVDQNLVDFGLTEALHLVDRPGINFIRPCSIFSEPALLGYASLGGIVIGLSVISAERRIIGALGSSVCLVALLLAASAGPLAVAVPLGLYLLIVRRAVFSRGLVPTFGLLSTVAALVWLLTPVSDTLINRAESVSTGNDASAQLRTELNEGSVEVWKDSPIVGVGLGNSRSNLSEVVTVPFLPGAQYPFNSANAYVNLLGEAGPVGVAGFVAVLFILWWRNSGAPAPLEGVTAAFIVLIALAFLIINGLVMPPLWFWAGLRLSLQEE